MPTFMPEVPGIFYEYFTLKMLHKLQCVNATEAEADSRCFCARAARVPTPSSTHIIYYPNNGESNGKENGK